MPAVDHPIGHARSRAHLRLADDDTGKNVGIVGGPHAARNARERCHEPDGKNGALHCVVTWFAHSRMAAAASLSEVITARGCSSFCSGRSSNGEESGSRRIRACAFV